VWDTSKYSIRLPLPELTQKIKATFATIDKDLREKTIQCNTLRAKLVQVEQNQSGSLLTRDLNKDLGEFKSVESEYLTTLFVVIPKNEQKNWLKFYETGTEYVVPRSSVKITEDAEYALYSVVLFNRVVDEFRNAARTKKFTVRKNDPSAVMSEEERKKLYQEYHTATARFEKWALNNFGEAFTAWSHLKCIQCYVESILRFGLPADFQAMLLTPRKGQEKKLEKTLCKLYSYLGENFEDLEDLDKDDKDNKAAMLLGHEKFFPFVFLDLDVGFGRK